MISLRYGFLCDFAGTIPQGMKPVIVGIFDVVFSQQPRHELQLPPHFVHLYLDATGDEATRRLMALNLVDADGETVAEHEFAITLAQKDDGLGLFARVNFGVNNIIRIPDFGMYNWVVKIDGRRLGEIPLTVLQLQPQGEQAPAP